MTNTARYSAVFSQFNIPVTCIFLVLYFPLRDFLLLFLNFPSLCSKYPNEEETFSYITAYTLILFILVNIYITETHSVGRIKKSWTLNLMAYKIIIVLREIILQRFLQQQVSDLSSAAAKPMTDTTHLIPIFWS
jgi:hypothetical protein